MLYKRTHTCGELTRDHVGQAVILNGWVDAWRDFGGLVFIDLRDRYGVTQVVFEPEAGAELQARAHELRNEYVIGVKGTVAPRLPGKENPKLETGAIEVRATDLVVYNASPTPPFEMHGPEPNEELRLAYRYLDLRRPALQQVFITRHRLAQLMRRIMTDLPEPELVQSQARGSAPWGARPRGVFVRGPRLFPLAMLALIAALVIPGAGWVFFAFLQVALALWLVACLAGIFAMARLRRRWRRHWESGDGTYWDGYQRHV